MLLEVGTRKAHDSVYGDNFAEDNANQQYEEKKEQSQIPRHLIRFFVVMRGVLTPPPRIDAPVTKIPLQ